ncbi:MAG: NAD-dependent epimerase/dehydratase family protein [bacterium]
MRTILVTGVAGFIGYHVAARLLERGDSVVGVDNVNPYYDQSLKRARLARLGTHAGFEFVLGDICDAPLLQRLCETHRPEAVVHLAAQAGVRHSLEHPAEYGSANLIGVLNVLEACRRADVGHLVMASSSSVYGANTSMPFAVTDTADHPLSLYAATKKAGELLAHSYAHLFRLPVTALRFFTVYGPFGRPDMALFSFTRAILAGTPIPLYNGGRMSRDFTYVGDLCDAIMPIVDRPAEPDPTWDANAPTPATSSAPYRVYNLGSDRPVPMRHIVALLERCLGLPAIIDELPMQPGDVIATWADMQATRAEFGVHPTTTIEEGVSRFVDWYRAFYPTELPMRARRVRVGRGGRSPAPADRAPEQRVALQVVR